MPIYEYECTKCKKVYEVRHEHDTKINLCCDEPCCSKLIKIVSLSSFRLVGSGWHKHGDGGYGGGLD